MSYGALRVGPLRHLVTLLDPQNNVTCVVHSLRQICVPYFNILYHFMLHYITIKI